MEAGGGRDLNGASGRPQVSRERILSHANVLPFTEAKAATRSRGLRLRQLQEIITMGHPRREVAAANWSPYSEMGL